MAYIDEINACLTYCEQQNGRPDCKNCGLNKAMIDGLVAEVDRRARADWLRSEIEKLESQKVAKGNYNCGEEGCCNPNPKDEREKEDFEWQIGYNTALTSIITRYKEELKVLEGK